MTNDQLGLISLFKNNNKMLIYDYIDSKKKNATSQYLTISYPEFEDKLGISKKTVIKLIQELLNDCYIFNKDYTTPDGKKHKAYTTNSKLVDEKLVELGNIEDTFKIDDNDDGSFEYLIEYSEKQRTIEDDSKDLHNYLSESNNKLFAEYLKKFEKSFGDYSEEDFRYWMGCLNNCKSQAHIKYVLQTAINSPCEPIYLSYREYHN